jgi:FkbM family methyltransferase
MNKISKQIVKLKRFFFKIITNKNHVDIANDGLTPIINGGYMHIERVIEYIDYFKLPRNGKIFDVGGGVGTTATMFSAAIPESEIHVFEPIKKSLERIKTVCSICKNVVFHNIALGNKEYEQEINITNNVTSSSLLDIEENIDSKFFADFLKINDSETIQVKRLDDLNIKGIINILKIDTQGFELEVIKGGEKTLPNINIIILELANHHFYKNAPQYYEIDEYLRGHEFQLYDMMPGIMKERKLYEWDSIYVNKKILK